MYKVAAKVKELSYYTRLNAEFKSDLFWWYYFLEHWNGLGLLRSTRGAQPANLCIQTDASGTWGCGTSEEKLAKRMQRCWDHGQGMISCTTHVQM